jgi:Rrf2 family transcriptional regulator, cysteine metabolism repressor
MKFSTRTRYGTRTLLDLALHKNEGVITLKDIAYRQQISLSYLKHLIGPLSNAGIIRSERGKQGGIALIKDPGDIRLLEIVNILEGTMAPVDCVVNPKYCTRSQHCATRHLWGDVKHAIDNVLNATTLQDLADKQQEQEKLQDTTVYNI